MVDVAVTDAGRVASRPPSGSSIELKQAEWRQVALLCLCLQDPTPPKDFSGRKDLNSQLMLVVQALIDVLASYGGKLVGAVERPERGEGAVITAVFGGHTASENDAERAIRSALQMYERLKLQNRDLVRAQVHLKLQVGIHFGWLTIQDDGSVDSEDIALRLARGLALAAPTDHLLVTADVKNLVADLFHYEGLGPIFITTAPDAVHAFRVTGVNHRIEGRWHRSRLVRRSQLIGRHRELEALQQAYATAESAITPTNDSSPAPEQYPTTNAHQGGPNHDSRPEPLRQQFRPTLIAISGSEGSGKSRLLYEFRRVTPPFREGLLTPLVGRAASIFPVPYALFSELLRNLFEIRGTDTPPVRARKIASEMPTLLELEPRLCDSLPVLTYLAGAATEAQRSPAESRANGAELPGISPFLNQQERNFQLELRVAFAYLLRGLADQTFRKRGHPLLVFLEDLHGMHRLSQDALISVFDRLELTSPLVIFATFRSGFKLPPELYHSTHIHEIELLPLRLDEERRIIRSMLDGADLPSALEARVLEKAGGNPYYLEELLRSLVDDRVLVNRQGGWVVDHPVEDVALPNTLGALLLSRIDALERSARDVLLRASVLGEHVDRGVLDVMQRLLQGPPLEPQLVQLEQLRLLKPADVAAEPQLVFENPLVREVSYQILLPQNKQTLHRVAGNAIEERFSASVGEHYLELANHFRLAMDTLRAATFYRLAGEKAQREYANELALTCYTTCLNLSHDTAEGRRVGWRQARVLRYMGRADEAAAILERLEAELAPPLDGTYTFVGEVALELSRVCRTIGRLSEAISQAERALRYFRIDGARSLEADALMALGKCRRLQGHSEEAQDMFRTALSLLKMLKLEEAQGQVLSNLGRLALDNGALDAARDYFQQALVLQERAVSRWGIALEIGHLGEVAYAAGEYDKADELFAQCLARSEPLDIRPLVAGALMYRGAIRLRDGDVEGGTALLDSGIRQAVALQDLPRQVRGYELADEAYHSLGRFDEASRARMEGQRLAVLAQMGRSN